MIVWGHAKGLFSSQFILLAVPLFFIISGFFHNQKDDFKTFFMKKFFRLYLPFVSCNLFLPTLTLIKRQILGLDITPNIAYIVQILLTINKDGFLFGATWFLASLFSISIIIKLLETILKIKHKEFEMASGEMSQEEFAKFLRIFCKNARCCRARLIKTYCRTCATKTCAYCQSYNRNCLSIHNKILRFI